MPFTFSKFTNDYKDAFGIIASLLSIAVILLGWFFGFFKFCKKKFLKLLAKIKHDKFNEKTLEEIQSICNILFIDDEEFNTVDILKRNHWKNVRWVNHIDSLDGEEIENAHILFIDIQGVAGELFKDEGLGLIKELKKIFPYKKYVIYTANFERDITDDGIHIADRVLKKNASPYEFCKVAEDLSKKFFSKEELLNNISNIINKKSPTVLKNIKKIIHELENKQEFSINKIKKMLKIDNVDKIIRLFKLYYQDEILFKK